MSEEHKYKLTYRLCPHPEGVTKAQIAMMGDQEHLGACDRIIVHSIIDTRDGGLSSMIMSINGHTVEPMPAEEEFKHWALMAHHLMERLPPGGRRELVTMVHETVKAAVREGRSDDRD